jgi:hypothetical protein
MIWAPLLLEQSISDCQYHTSFFPDHRYMLLKFHPCDVFAQGPGVWKLNVSLLDSPAYCALVRSFWKTQESSSTFSSSLDWWDQGKFFLREGLVLRVCRRYIHCGYHGYFDAGHL